MALEAEIIVVVISRRDIIASEVSLQDQQVVLIHGSFLAFIGLGLGVRGMVVRFA